MIQFVGYEIDKSGLRSTRKKGEDREGGGNVRISREVRCEKALVGDRVVCGSLVGWLSVAPSL